MIGYYLFLGLEKLLMLLPRAWRKALFIGLADLAYLTDGKHRRVIMQNLHFALGNSLGQEEEKRIGRYCYRNLLLALLQIIENRYSTSEAIVSRVQFKNREVVDNILGEDRPVIFVTAHYGNWEIAGAAISSAIIPTTVVYKALNNPYFDQYLYDARSLPGLHPVEKRGAVKALAKVLKAGGTVSLLTDQNTSERDGIVVNFFGRTARQTAAPAFLARKYNAAIIPIYTTTEDDENYTLTFHDPIEVAHTDDAESDILIATQLQADIHEKVIRDDPKFWFWCHRRWKTEHPEIYRT